MASFKKEIATDSKPESSIKRFRIGFNVILQVVLMFIIVAAVNMVSCRKYKQWDKSHTQLYSLSEQTTKILGSLTNPIYLTVVFDRDSDTHAYAKRMLELYKKAADDKLKIRYIDPRRDPSAIAELRNQDANLFFEQNKILVSKRERLEVKSGETEQVGFYNVVTDKDMFQRAETAMFRESGGGKGRIVQYRFENALTAAILSTSQDRKQKLYIITNLGGLRKDSQGKDAGGVLKLFGGQRQNLEVEPLQLSPHTDIPQDASTVMIIAPNRDLGGGELKKLFRDYWEERHGGVVILFNPEYYDDMPNLVGYLEGFYGVRIEDDRILTTKSEGGRNVKVPEVMANFYPDSPITKGLSHLRLPGQSCSINIDLESSADALAPRIRDKKPLMLAYSEYWRERDFKNPIVIREDREGDNTYLAASIEKGAGVNQELRLNSSRMMLVGNGRLVDPDVWTPEAVEFVLSGVNWTSDRDELVRGISPRKGGTFRIAVGDKPYEKLKRMSVQILPGIVILIGLIVAYMRRR